jgi:hypothetical protein
MKKFKCTYLKIDRFAPVDKLPKQFIEQEIVTDQDGITVVTPKDYALISIVEVLPQLNQCKNEKAINNN